MPDHPVNEAINLISGEFWGRNPHEELRWMRENAPVYRDERGGVWGIAKHSDLRLVSRTPAVFSNAQGIRADADPMPMMIDMDDPAHKQRRKLINSGFTPRRIAGQEGYLRRICDEIINEVSERGECDFVSDIAAMLPLIVIGDALGVAPEDRKTLLTWSDDMVRGLTGGDDPDLLVKAGEAFAGFTEYAGKAIAQRHGSPKDDLLTILVHAEVDGDRLDHDSLVQESLLLLVGGDETTRHVISGGMYQLCVHPDQRQKLIDDPDKIPTAVEEMLRWVSPIKNMNRTATRDYELRGQRIREGDNVLLLYPSANRDEDVFADPFRFDVERTPNDHIAFGNGAHFCLGNSLARLELKVMFERLLDRLPDIEPVDDTEPAYRAANFVSGYETFKVRFTPAPRVPV